MPGYECWSHHGEVEQITEEGDDAYDEEQISAGECHATTDDDALMYEVDTSTIFPSTQEDETSSQGDSTTHEQDGMSQMLKEFKENCEDQKLYKKYARMIEDSEKEMYKGCKPHYTKLATMLEVMQMKQKFGWSDKSVTKLLPFLQDLVPEGNQMPESYYKAKQIVCPLGMEVRRIHACKNDCILYRGDNADLRQCLVCKFPRFKIPKGEEAAMADDSDDDDMDTDQANKKKKKPGRKDIPVKVCWFLPVTPRLERLFANPDTAKLMRWHEEERIRDGMLRHPADSPQWRNVDRLRPLDRKSVV